MDLCGSIFLDEAFQEYLSVRMGKDKLRKLPQRTYRELIRTWENNVKRQYHKDTPEVTINLPHEVAKAIKSLRNMVKRKNGNKQLTGDLMRLSS